MWSQSAAESPLLYSKPKQRGAVAIEFAAIFLLFFALVYGSIAFGLPAVARLGFQHYSVEASRAALKVDTNDPYFEGEAAMLRRVGEQIDSLIIDESWLPATWRNGCTDLGEGEGESEDEPAEWTALPDTVYGYWRPEPNALPNANPRYQVNVCIQASDPIVPQLVLGNDLRFPPYADNTGRSWVRGYTIITL